MLILEMGTKSRKVTAPEVEVVTTSADHRHFLEVPYNLKLYFGAYQFIDHNKLFCHVFIQRSLEEGQSFSQDEHLFFYKSPSMSLGNHPKKSLANKLQVIFSQSSPDGIAMGSKFAGTELVSVEL